VRVAIDHGSYHTETELSAQVRASLSKDLGLAPSAPPL